VMPKRGGPQRMCPECARPGTRLGIDAGHCYK
jgi:hypothetical protein